VLTDLPWLEVARGRTPVVLDAYALARRAVRQPRVADRLVARIEAKEFDRIVLSQLQLAEGDDPADYAFGPAVLQAIEREYEPIATVRGLRVLAPRPRGTAEPTAESHR
jgi:hypothetical protein